MDQDHDFLNVNLFLPCSFFFLNCIFIIFIFIVIIIVVIKIMLIYFIFQRN